MSVTFLDVFIWKARGQCLSVGIAKMCQGLTETKSDKYMSRNFPADTFSGDFVFLSFLYGMKMVGWDTAQLVECLPSLDEDLSSVSSSI